MIMAKSRCNIRYRRFSLAEHEKSIFLVSFLTSNEKEQKRFWFFDGCISCERNGGVHETWNYRIQLKARESNEGSGQGHVKFSSKFLRK